MPEALRAENLVKGRYEMSLAEFPVTLLSKSNGKECIEYRDTIRGKDNLEVLRSWKVYPDAKLGFGTASTLSTLYELFQVWKEQRFCSKTITFGSLYSLSRRKGIVPTNTSYETLRKDLRCLTGIVIEAKNAFWDNEKQAYVDAYFHLFERVRFYKEHQFGQATLPFSYIEASDELFGSVTANSLFDTEFDSRFFHSLKPTEQRLSIYLSKVLRNKNVFKRDLMKLAEQLPLTTKLKKKAKQQLKLAAGRLVEKNFKLLGRFDFEKSKNGSGENMVFYRRNPLTERSGKGSASRSKEPKPLSIQNLLIQDILAICGDEASIPFYRKVAALMPKELIFQTISEVKEVRDLGVIQKSKGALFTKLIKEKAQKIGVEL
jgi:hypothetical protein